MDKLSHLPESKSKRVETEHRVSQDRIVVGDEHMLLALGPNDESGIPPAMVESLENTPSEKRIVADAASVLSDVEVVEEDPDATVGTFPPPTTDDAGWIAGISAIGILAGGSSGLLGGSGGGRVTPNEDDEDVDPNDGDADADADADMNDPVAEFSLDLLEAVRVTYLAVAETGTGIAPDAASEGIELVTSSSVSVVDAITTDLQGATTSTEGEQEEVALSTNSNDRETRTMEQLDELQQQLPIDPSMAMEALSGLQDAFEGIPLPMPGGDSGDAPALPFGGETQAALMNSAAEGTQFLTETLPGYFERGAAAVESAATAYQEAFTGLAENIPMPPGGGETDPEAPAPGTATAEALATGLDNLGAAVANSLGSTENPENGEEFGAVYAGEVIGEALTGAGEDFGAAAELGAAAITAGAAALAAMAPGGDEGGGMDVPGEQMLVDGINTGLTALRDGYNQGAEALSGTLPEALADGITSGGDQVLAGATMLSEAFTGAIEGGGEGGGGLPTPPGGGADPAEALQAALMDGAAQLQEALGGAGGGGDPAEALQAALMDGAAQLQEALGGAGGGGAPALPFGPEDLMGAAGELQSAISSGATQLEMALEPLTSQFPA